MPRFEGTTEMDKIGANLRVTSKSSLTRGVFLKSPETSRVYFGGHNSRYIFATSRV